jgi:hypothetical protein
MPDALIETGTTILWPSRRRAQQIKHGVKDNDRSITLGSKTVLYSYLVSCIES